MKKIILSAYLYCFLPGECISQAGEWTWMKGDTVPVSPGHFGVKGAEDVLNNPPGLYGACAFRGTSGQILSKLINGIYFMEIKPVNESTTTDFPVVKRKIVIEK